MTVFGAIVIWLLLLLVDSSWNVMAHGDAQEGKWRGNWWMEWVASTLHTTSEHGVSSITTADTRASAASIWQDWRPHGFKWTRLFRRKTKSGFCACVITFQLASTNILHVVILYQMVVSGGVAPCKACWVENWLLCAHLAGEKKFLFFFPVFIAVFVERTTFFFFLCFFFPQITLSVLVFVLWLAQKARNLIFSFFSLQDCAMVFPVYFSRLSPLVLQSVDFKNSSNTTCPVLTCVSMNNLKPFTRDTSERQ